MHDTSVLKIIKEKTLHRTDAAFAFFLLIISNIFFQRKFDPVVLSGTFHFIVHSVKLKDHISNVGVFLNCERYIVTQ